MGKAYQSAPNAINQDEMAFILQELKISNPRLWQAISGLKSNPPPMPYNYEISLPGKQNVVVKALGYSPILRMPTDPYGVWEIDSLILQSVEITCKIKPASSNYVADVLVSRNRRDTYVSIFKSSSTKLILKVGGDYSKLIGATELGTTEFFDGDEFQLDVIQADGTISDVWIALRGYYNLKKLKKQK